MTNLLMSMHQSHCLSFQAELVTVLQFGALVQWVLNSGASAFYEEAGEAAAALGLTVDVFAISPRTCGLNAIQALASGSGGCIRLYQSLQHAAMPQVQTPFSASL